MTRHDASPGPRPLGPLSLGLSRSSGRQNVRPGPHQLGPLSLGPPRCSGRLSIGLPLRSGRQTRQGI